MRGETSTPAYGRGVFLMIAVTLPLTLLVLSVLLWMDPEETTALPLVIANNGLGLLLIGAFPAAVVSLLHTQLLQRDVRRKVTRLGLRSVVYGALLGLALGVGVSLLTFATLSSQLWLLYLWGTVVGILYGLMRA